MAIRSSNVSAADFTDWQRDAHAFDAIAAFSTFSTTMRGRGPDAAAERIAAALQVNLFSVLGVSTGGRPRFRQRGRASRRGHRVDRQPRLLAAAVRRRRQARSAGSCGPAPRPRSSASCRAASRIPTRWSSGSRASSNPATDPRDNRSFEAIGRLRPGVSVEEAQAELDTISARLDAAYPATNRGWQVRAVPLTDYIVGDARRTLLLLLGAVGLVMLVACANVANLFLAHAAGRQREIAVRSAIGAARGRIFRQVLTESVLLSHDGGRAGHRHRQLGPAAVDCDRRERYSAPRAGVARSERPVFSVAVSIATGVVFGILPAVLLSRSNLVQALREGTRGAGSRHRTRKVLVVAEVAMALVLLVAAGLLTRSFRGLQRMDVGFDPHSVLTMRVRLSGPKYRRPAADAAFFDRRCGGSRPFPASDRRRRCWRCR